MKTIQHIKPSLWGLLNDCLRVVRFVVRYLAALVLIVVGVLYFTMNFLLGFVFDLFVDILDRLDGENGE